MKNKMNTSTPGDLASATRSSFNYLNGLLNPFASHEQRTESYLKTFKFKHDLTTPVPFISADLSFLRDVTHIGDDFLGFIIVKSFSGREYRKQTGINSLDLTALTNVISIGSNFLSGCTKLEEIKLKRTQTLIASRVPNQSIIKYV